MGNKHSNPAPTAGTSSGVQCLEDLAFDAFYNNFLCKATSSNVEFVRECMEEKLPGTVRKHTRDKCIQKLNENYGTKLAKSVKKQDINVCVFLDCILDSSFVTKLEIHAPYSGLESFSQLMSIISYRCPKLEWLVINFHSCNLSKSKIEENSNSKVVHRFNRLEMLCVRHIHDVGLTHQHESKHSILGIIAEYCPILTHLTVIGFSIRKKDVLALIIGASAIPFDDVQWTEDLVLENLKVPAEYLSPLCFKLRYLRLPLICITRCPCNPSFSNSTAAFVYRHLPALRSSNLPVPTIKTIKLLYSNRVHNASHQKTEIQKAFEEHCKSTGIIQECPRRILSGLLQINSLESVPIRDAETLRAVGYMCPHLDHFVFRGEMYPIRSARNADLWNPQYKNLAPGELQTILSAWPKLDRISLLNFQPNLPLLKPVLSTFSPTLTYLSFSDCSQINLPYLAVCTRLQYLRIYNSFLSSESSAPPLNPISFLPSLKHFGCDVCLGDFAHLFERKSTLIQVELHCCHIGTDVYSDGVGWSQVPKLWPCLESLEVGQATGLTMDIVSEFVPQLPKLGRILLPVSVIILEESDLTRKITQDGCERKQRLIIRHCSLPIKPCPYQRT